MPPQAQSSSSPGDVHNRRRFGRRAAARSRAGRADYLAAAAGPLADALVFITALRAGMVEGAAQITSFWVGLLILYGLRTRPALVAAGRAGDLRLHGRLLVTSLFALFFRGGVLAWLTDAAGLPGQLAIVPTIVVSVGILRAGYAFSLSSPKWSIGGGARWQVTAVCALACAFALRLIYLAQMQLIPEEAYYWNYSQHPAMSYLDHPPMVAWLIRLGTVVFGQTALGVRIGALASAVVASFFTYRLTRNLFGGASALVALLLMQVLPYFFLCGLLMTPDAPLIAAWSACLYGLERALPGGRSAGWWGAGVALGLGLLSKYTIGLLVPAVLLFLLLDPKSRRWLTRPEPYAAVALALAIFSPVIVWNAQHDWASFAFQTSRRLAEHRQFSLHKLIISMLILLTPTGVVTLVATFRRASPASDKARGSDAADPEMAARRQRFLQTAILVPLAVFAGFSLYHDVKLDWTGALCIAAVPVLAYGIVCCAKAPSGPLRAWIRDAWGPTTVAVLLIFGGCLHYLVLGLPGLGYSSHVETVPVVWRDFGRQIQQLASESRASMGSQPLIVGMDRYVIASELAFYAPDHRQSVAGTASRNLFGQEGLMYGLWFAPAQEEGRTLLLVGWSPQDIAGPAVQSRVEKLGPVEEGTLQRYGTFVRHYYYRLAYGYRNRSS